MLTLGIFKTKVAYEYSIISNSYCTSFFKVHFCGAKMIFFWQSNIHGLKMSTTIYEKRAYQGSEIKLTKKYLVWVLQKIDSTSDLNNPLLPHILHHLELIFLGEYLKKQM